MAKIHTTAVIEAGATLADDIEIGPFCIVGAQAILHPGVRLHSHVVISNRTEIGAGTVVYPFASLGTPGQIYQNAAVSGRLVIGARCEIREHVTMNCGSPKARNETLIGDDCMFMVGAHVAHDCHVGRKCIFANNATLGGHVDVGEHVFIGGLSAVHQFCSIGEHAMIGGVTAVRGHIIPYGNVADANLIGLNLVGLSRRGFTDADLKLLNKAYRAIFFGKKVFADRLQDAKTMFKGHAHVERILSFIEHADKKRHLTLPTERK